MNETVLCILLVAGVMGIAATVWLAARTAAAKRAASVAPAERRQTTGPREQGVDEPPVPRAAATPRTPVTQARPVQDSDNGVPDVLTLLQRAHEQLSTRQHKIESELARIEQLRGEREAVAIQAAALEQAMKAFAMTSALPREMEPYIFETSGKPGSEMLTV